GEHLEDAGGGVVPGEPGRLADGAGAEALPQRRVGGDAHEVLGQLGVVGGQQAALAVVHRVDVTGDAGGDGGRAARRRLREGHAPAFAHRRRGHRPRAAVEVDELVVGHAAGEGDVAAGVERLDQLVEVAALGAGADD